MSWYHFEAYKRKTEETDNEHYFSAEAVAILRNGLLLKKYWLHWPPSKEMFLAPIFVNGMWEADRRHARRTQRKELSDEVQ